MLLNPISEMTFPSIFQLIIFFLFATVSVISLEAEEEENEYQVRDGRNIRDVDSSEYEQNSNSNSRPIDANTNGDSLDSSFNSFFDLSDIKVMGIDDANDQESAEIFQHSGETPQPVLNDNRAPPGVIYSHFHYDRRHKNHPINVTRRVPSIHGEHKDENGVSTDFLTDSQSQNQHSETSDIDKQLNPTQNNNKAHASIIEALPVSHVESSKPPYFNIPLKGQKAKYKSVRNSKFRSVFTKLSENEQGPSDMSAEETKHQIETEKEPTVQTFFQNSQLENEPPYFNIPVKDQEQRSSIETADGPVIRTYAQNSQHEHEPPYFNIPFKGQEQSSRIETADGPVIRTYVQNSQHEHEPPYFNIPSIGQEQRSSIETADEPVIRTYAQNSQHEHEPPYFNIPFKGQEQSSRIETADEPVIHTYVRNSQQEPPYFNIPFRGQEQSSKIETADGPVIRTYVQNSQHEHEPPYFNIPSKSQEQRSSIETADEPVIRTFALNSQHEHEPPYFNIPFKDQERSSRIETADGTVIRAYVQNSQHEHEPPYFNIPSKGQEQRSSIETADEPVIRTFAQNSQHEHEPPYFNIPFKGQEQSSRIEPADGQVIHTYVQNSQHEQEPPYFNIPFKDQEENSKNGTQDGPVIRTYVQNSQHEQEPPYFNIPFKGQEQSSRIETADGTVIRTYVQNSQHEHEPPYFNVPFKDQEENSKKETQDGPVIRTYVQTSQLEKEPPYFNTPFKGQEGNSRKETDDTPGDSWNRESIEALPQTHQKNSEKSFVDPKLPNTELEKEQLIQKDNPDEPEHILNLGRSARSQASESQPPEESVQSHAYASKQHDGYDSSLQSTTEPHEVEEDVSITGNEGDEIGSAYNITLTSFDSKISTETQSQPIGSIKVRQYEKLGSVFSETPEFQSLLPKFKLYKKKLKVLISEMIPNCPDIHSKKILKVWAKLFKKAFPNYDEMTRLSMKYAQKLKEMLNLCLRKIVQKKFIVPDTRSSGKSKLSGKQDSRSIESESETGNDKVAKREASQDEFVASFTTDVIDPLVNYFVKMPEMVKGTYKDEA